MRETLCANGSVAAYQARCTLHGAADALDVSTNLLVTIKTLIRCNFTLANMDLIIAYSSVGIRLGCDSVLVHVLWK